MQPHFAVDQEFKSTTAAGQWDEAVDKVFPKHAPKHEDKDEARYEPKDGLVSWVIGAGTMAMCVGALFFVGAIAWGPSGSFFRSILNLWGLVLCGAIVYAQTLWPNTQGETVPCPDHDKECAKSMTHLFQQGNQGWLAVMFLHLLGLLLREGTIIHKIYAEKITTGSISDPLLV
jgi:hypothetical protein